MKKIDAETLLAKFRVGKCTPAEKRLLDRAFVEFPLADLSEISEGDYQKMKSDAWDRLEAQLSVRSAKSIKRLRARRMYAAAGVLLLLITGWAAIEMWRFSGSAPYTFIDPNEIMPASDQTILMLADGTPVPLSNTHSGIVIGGQEIRYADGSSVPVHTRELSQKMTLTTPKGGTYRVELPDGSRVQLNAASTLTYPGLFDAHERVVELSGEAFFSVNRMTQPGDTGAVVPFRVLSQHQVVEVTGTAFNLAAYPDDPITRTTLVEGKVNVQTSAGSIELYPGEQSLTRSDLLEKAVVDVTQHVAWTRGYFRLSADLETILAEVSRWYDIEVEFVDAELKEARASIIVLRDKPLSVVLSMLEEVTPARFVVAAKELQTPEHQRERRLQVMY